MEEIGVSLSMWVVDSEILAVVGGIPSWILQAHAVVTCQIKLFQNYFSLRRRPSQIILFRCVIEICLKLFQNYSTGFTGLLQLMNMFQPVYCR